MAGLKGFPRPSLKIPEHRHRGSGIVCFSLPVAGCGRQLPALPPAAPVLAMSGAHSHRDVVPIRAASSRGDSSQPARPVPTGALKALHAQ